MAFSKQQMLMISKKLSSVADEISKLEVLFLPAEKASKKELAELKKIEAEMRKGRRTRARELFAELG